MQISTSSPLPSVFIFTAVALISACGGNLSNTGPPGGGANTGNVNGPLVNMAPWAGTYHNVHFKDDGTTLLNPTPVPAVVLPLDFDGPTSTKGIISYALSGDAVQGIHFDITPGFASPLHVPANQNGASISVDLDPLGQAGQVWFEEKILIITLTGSTNTRLGPSDEFRLFIRSTAPPPEIAFKNSAGSGGWTNTNLIDIDQIGNTWEETRVFYTLSGDAVEGIDYRIRPGFESGTLSISAGGTSAQLDLWIDQAATPGRKIIVTLDHENIDRSDENMWVGTHGWSLDETNPQFAGQPSPHSTGGGSLTNAPPDTLGLEIIPQTDPMPKTAPDGHVLEGIVQTEDYEIENNWYIRPSFENQYHCGGGPNLHPLPVYTRTSVYVETFMPSESWRDADFVCLNIRNRIKDINHRVVLHRSFDEADVILDKNGIRGWGDPVKTPTGYWGLWATYDLDPDGSVWGEDFGVTMELHDEERLTRLWLNHHADEEEIFSNGKTEEVGKDLMTSIFRFTYFSPSTERDWSFDPKGKGLLAYWPKLEMSDTPLSGTPLRFWEKRGGFWEPRGNACIRPSAINTHTFTIN